MTFLIPFSFGSGSSRTFRPRGDAELIVRSRDREDLRYGALGMCAVPSNHQLKSLGRGCTLARPAGCVGTPCPCKGSSFADLAAGQSGGAIGPVSAEDVHVLSDGGAHLVAPGLVERPGQGPGVRGGVVLVDVGRIVRPLPAPGQCDGVG